MGSAVAEHGELDADYCCPICHGYLDNADSLLSCRGCSKTYPITAGIPDLRMRVPAWIDFDVDVDRALVAERTILAKGLETAIFDIFRNSRGFDEPKAAYRVRQVFAGLDKCEKQIDGWLGSTLDQRPVLELGCGPGQLLAACARAGKPVLGVDVSLEWLVVAKHLVQSQGGTPRLCAALAEGLPFRDSSLGAVISLDVIEHVADQASYVKQIARVLRADGRVAISTPNRYSLSPEPHVGVWGVGFLPERYQARWVKFVSGADYEYTRLLSVFEVKRLFESANSLDVEVSFPTISDDEIAIFSKSKARLARVYNALIEWRPIRALAPFFGAYYRVIGIAHSRLN